MAMVRSHGCCICKNPAADAHHLRIIGHARGMSIKNSDKFTIPLCRKHHDELHMFGDEKLFLDIHGLDPLEILKEINGGSFDIQSEIEGEES